MADHIFINPAALRAVIQAHCQAAGSNLREAILVAQNLVMANLSGHDSHGAVMLPQYLIAVREERLKINQSAQLVGDNGPLVTVDGRMGYGQVVGHEAIEIAIRRAKSHGVCILALRNCHHIGRIGHWGEQCAAADLISSHYVNVVNRPPLVAPFNGADARFSTNPYCAAIPGPNGEPILLDMASSKIAMGKVRVAMNKGQEVEPNTLITCNGTPTNDPKVMWASPTGAILPFGDHKGYGLAVVTELMAGAITGGGTLRDQNWGNNTITNNMLSILFDPDKLNNNSTWRNEVRAFIEWVKGSPSIDGRNTVLVAGEPELISRKKRAKAIPLDRNSWQQIVSAGVDVGISAERTCQIAEI